MSEEPMATERIPEVSPLIDRVVLRSWPKIVLMIPTLIAALICGGIMHVKGTPTEDAAFGFTHLVNLLFLLVLMVNLTVLLYDLNLRGFIIICLLILVVVLAIFLLNHSLQGGAWQAIGKALSVRVFANSSFYFLLSLVLLLNLSIAWVITRFHYWVVERNEIIIYKGFMSEQERHPTAQARFKLVVDDVVEYALLHSGRLVFFFGDSDTQVDLPNVLGIRRKAKILDELLGRIAVTQR